MKLSNNLQVGAVYIWSYVYVIMKISAEKTNRGERTDSHHSVVIIRSCDAASENTEPLLLSKVPLYISLCSILCHALSDESLLVLEK